MLFSLKLYVHLDNEDNSGNEDYQLTSRFMVLSNTLHSLGRLDDSFRVSCWVLAYEAKRISASDLTEEVLLDDFANKSLGVLPPSCDVPVSSQATISICRRLTAHLVDLRRQGKSEQHSRSSNTTVDKILDSFWNQSLVEHSSSKSPIGYVLQFQDIVGEGENALKILLPLLDVLLLLGQSIHQMASGNDTDESLLTSVLVDHSRLVKLLNDFIAFLDLQNTSLYKCLLRLIASASLVPVACKSWTGAGNTWQEEIDQIVIDEALLIAEQGIELLQEERNCSSEEKLGFVFESLKLSLETLRLALRPDDSEDIIARSISTSKLLVNTGNDAADADDFLSMLAKKWSIWTISNLRNMLDARGMREQATILSLWCVALTENDEVNILWFHSSVITDCIDETNLLCATDAFIKSTNIPTTESSLLGSVKWIFEKELQLCQIHLSVLKHGAECHEAFSSLKSRLDHIRAEIENCDMENMDGEFCVLYLWVMSTTYLVHSDLAIAYGYFPEALRSTQLCLRYCQAVMKRSGMRFENSASWISSLATSTVLARAATRYIQVLVRRPKLHYRMGNHRKADAYMRSVLDLLKIDSVLTISDHDDQRITLKQLMLFLKGAPHVRPFLETKGWASTPDNTIKELSEYRPHDTTLAGNATSITDFMRDLIAGESSFSLVYFSFCCWKATDSYFFLFLSRTVGDVLYGDSLTQNFNGAFVPFYEETIKEFSYNRKLIETQLTDVPSTIERNFGISLTKHVELRNARVLFENPQTPSEIHFDTRVYSLCREIQKSEFTFSDDKAWALYYLGVMELSNARESGILQRLWRKSEQNGQSMGVTEKEEEVIARAREYLSRASLYTMNSSDVLRRNIVRSLALTQGPFITDSIGMSAGILVLSSIGQSLRRRMTWSFSNSPEDCERIDINDLQRIFSTFDGPPQVDRERDCRINQFLNDLASVTPPSWKFIAPVICPTGEILVTSLVKSPSADQFNFSTTCIFPSGESNAYDTIMKPFDSILQQVQEQLHQAVPSNASEKTDKEAMKRKWWEERSRLDDELCALLQNVETMYFSEIFDELEPDSTGDDSDTSSDSSDNDDLPRGNLASRFEEAVEEVNGASASNHEGRVKTLNDLTVPTLKEMIRDMGVEESEFKRLRKMDLIQFITEEQDKAREDRERKTNKTKESATKLDNPDQCIFLILDENLHRFPFEGMPCLENKNVCRVPCLSFVLATLYEFECSPNKSLYIDPTQGTYVLDPENNLHGTRDRLLPVVKQMESRWNCKWDGVVGEMPDASVFTAGLSKPNGIMMYFGHGGAQTCFSRRRVEDLIDCRVSSLNGQQGQNSCQSAVVLMGCSSGRLISINRKNSDTLEQTPLYYEPEGVALSYLCAGAPCVVGNLWDVTDNDIDKFSISLFEHFFVEGESLSRSVSFSRSVCKLPYLVGCAPVCYGVPVLPMLKNPQNKLNQKSDVKSVVVNES